MDLRETCMIRRPVTKKRNNLQARDYRFSVGEMRLYQIQGVYNSVSRVADMDDDYVRRFVGIHFIQDMGEVVLSEKKFFMVGDVEMCVLSVVVFGSLFGMQLYMIRFKKDYLDIAVDKSLNGMFN